MLSHTFASTYLHNHNMETRRDVFQAIADPTRRAIIGMIAKQPISVNTIAERFDVSRQAISLHLKVLAECGLLNIRQLGRERLCEAKLEKLNEVHTWIEQYHQLWTERLNALEKFIEQEELQAINPDIENDKKDIGKNKSKKKK
jgi:DNA-binding transcriptional ArsR family regulator